MTFSTFFMILLLAYVFYYVLIILSDTLPAKAHRSASVNGQQDFVLSAAGLQPPATPVKVEEDISAYMPQVDTGEDNEPEEDEDAENNTDSLQDAMRMESYSDEDREVVEVDEEELKWMIA